VNCRTVPETDTSAVHQADSHYLVLQMVLFGRGAPFASGVDSAALGGTALVYNPPDRFYGCALNLSVAAAASMIGWTLLCAPAPCCVLSSANDKGCDFEAPRVGVPNAGR